MLLDRRGSSFHDRTNSGDFNVGLTLIGGGGGGKKRNYVKKPLNAFMLFMKEMRQKVIEECTLKESAAINQILGRKVSASSP